MKIIKTDAYGRESVADKLVAVNVSEYWGRIIVSLLNNNETSDNTDYFELVDNDHVLWRGMDELV